MIGGESLLEVVSFGGLLDIEVKVDVIVEVRVVVVPLSQKIPVNSSTQMQE